MSNLIIKGKDELGCVSDLIKKFQEDNDISHLQLAGHHLQQSVEFFIKGSILLLGSDYRQVHPLRPNLRLLLNLLRSNRQLPELLVQNFERPLTTLDREYIIDLDSWEAGVRYDEDLDVDLKEINKILSLAEELQEASSELDKGEYAF